MISLITGVAENGIVTPSLLLHFTLLKADVVRSVFGDKRWLMF